MMASNAVEMATVMKVLILVSVMKVSLAICAPALVQEHSWATRSPSSATAMVLAIMKLFNVIANLPIMAKDAIRSVQDGTRKRKPNAMATAPAKRAVRASFNVFAKKVILELNVFLAVPKAAMTMAKWRFALVTALAMNRMTTCVSARLDTMVMPALITVPVLW